MPLKKCLIVDDEIDICDILSFYLERTSKFASIITATDGNDAMFKLENQVFDLILLDCNMPKASGLTVIENLGKNSIENVCVISGDIDMEVAKGFVDKGVKHFLIKPFDKENFLKRVNEIVQVVEDAELAC